MDSVELSLKIMEMLYGHKTAGREDTGAKREISEDEDSRLLRTRLYRTQRSSRKLSKHTSLTE